MRNLPPGFIIDEPMGRPISTSLPPGFVLDDQKEAQQPETIPNDTRQYSGNILKDVASNAPRILWESAGELKPMAQRGLQGIANYLPETGKTRSPILNTVVGAPRAAVETLAKTAPDFVSRASMIASAANPSLLKPIVKPIANAIGTGAKTAGSILTGVPRQSFQRLYEEPSAILSLSKEKAVQLYGAAQAGKAALTDEQAFASASKRAKDILAKVRAGEASPIEALEGRQELDQIISTTRNQRKVGKLMKIREVFDGVVKSDPTLAQADKLYAKTALGGEFRKIFPVNKGGTPSYVRSTVAPILATVGGSPLMAGLASPAVAGGITAAAGGIAKAGKALAPIMASGSSRALGGAIMSKLTEDKAREFLKQANGDKNLARKLAREAGYSF